MSSTPSPSWNNDSPPSDESPQGADATLDKTLRPSAWGDYIGQTLVKKNLEVLLRAAKARGEPPEHVLFYGPPGLGKTTLSHLIAGELAAQIKITSGPAIERVGDLASILTNLSSGDVLFIDEIHRLNKSVEEVLYPAMESGVLDIVIGKGPSARTIQLELAPFTLVAATTRVALLSAPLRSRFSGGVFRLKFYTEDEIKRILERSAQLLDIEIDEAALSAIAARSRATPRTANYLLKRCRDYAQVNDQKLGKEAVGAAVEMLEIDELGLSEHDRRVLETVIEKFSGGPVGIGTLSTALSEEADTLEEVNEPFLIQLGLLERTPRGRVVTAAGYQHLGRTPPDQTQASLIE